MPVPSTISDLSATAADNYPQGSENVFPNLDNFIRAYGAFIRQLSDSLALKAPAANPTITGTAIFTGSISVPIAYIDSGFNFTTLGSNPLINLDSFDYLSYDRGANSLDTYIGGILKGYTSAVEGPSRTNDAATPNGLTRLSQVEAGLGLRVPNSAFTGSNQSLAANGYQKLPGGLIVQWGEASYPSGGASGVNVTFSYPIPFPSKCVAMSPVDRLVGLQDHLIARADLTSSLSQATVTVVDVSTAALDSGSFYYIAIGY